MEAMIIVTPMETFKVRLIHDKFMPTPRYRNLFHGIYTIFRKEGARGCYKGLLATMLKQSTNQGVRFLVYEDAKKFFKKYIPIDFFVNFIAGSVAGAASVIVNNPIDVVKTNMQGLHTEEFNGFFGCFSWIWKKDGLKGFYRGVGPRMARVILDVSLTFSLWNFIMDLFDFFRRGGKKG
jgi:solute carrier family 25 citrate transporter 1